MAKPKLDTDRARKALQEFRFSDLFIEELGWNNPTNKKSIPLKDGDGQVWNAKEISQLSGFRVFEVTSSDAATTLPDAKSQEVLWKGLTAQAVENVAIFVDQKRSQSLWLWMKREDKKFFPRRHHYLKGQPGDLFLSKLASIAVDISELDAEGNIPITEVADRLREALDVERVTKHFYKEFQQQHLDFLALIDGIGDERQRCWYASVLLNRLMFIYFLQRKSFLDGGNVRYLQEKLEQSRKQGRDKYFSGFLHTLFFEGFAKPEKERSAATRKLLGQIRYLNGGLFLPHKVEMENKNIRVPDEAFANLFALFERYSWNLDDTPGGNDDEINPDVLGYIFEKYINQKEFGAYYTRPEITNYLCEQTIYKLVLEKINAATPPPPRRFDSIPDLLLALDANLCRQLLGDILPSLSLLDPACGSGAFLVAAMKTLINLYSAILGKIEFLHDRTLTDWLAQTRAAHPSLHYFIKKRIITDNLFGVDIMEEGTEIARLRLFLALVASAHSVEQLEPLPNIDFNILAGNSLIGLLKVDPQRFDAIGEKKNAGRQGLIKLKHGGASAELPAFAVETTVAPSQREKVVAFVAERNAGKFAAILADKNKSIELYRKHAFKPEEVGPLDQDVSLVQLRSHIDNVRRESYGKLNQLLLDEFKSLGIQFEQATWDDAKNTEGKSIKSPLTLADIEALSPFHWGYEFDQIINDRGGFDAIITNPPWEIFKPNSKEFFEVHSDLVTKKKMTIQSFEKARSKLLKDPEIRDTWIEYLSGFPHVSAYYRAARNYENQISIVNGKKKVGTDVNLYKLFVERCYHLLRKGGECGIVVPSGIYTDLGTKQLRELLFEKTTIGGLFCFENRREIFEGVHRSYKFVILTFERGHRTLSFPAAFMRLDVQELLRFPSEGSISISVDLIKSSSPDSLSVPEIKNEVELQFLRKASGHPPLNHHPSYGHIKFCRELDPTAIPRLFRNSPTAGYLPLLEGRNVHQFTSTFSDETRFWIRERDGRRLVLGRIQDIGQTMDYQKPRLGFRKIARNTDERTLIATVVPASFASENFQTTVVFDAAGKRIVENHEQILLAGILNSFVFDALIRLKVSANINFFFVYSTQVPLTGSSLDNLIVSRAAKLICTTPEFDDLAREVGLGSHAQGVTDSVGRAQLRAELDGLIAHLYDLTEDEFAYILTTFPLVAQPVKDAALEAYRTFAPKPGDPAIAALLAAGESAKVEFKSSARWDLRENKKNPAMEQVILKTVAAFLNSEGGTLLLGVADDGNVLGLEHDYQTLQKKNADGYELFLSDLLLAHYGKDLSRFLKFSFHEVEGKQVCRIVAQSAPRAVWVKEGNDEHLYVRAGNSTRRLSTKETIEYCKTRF